MRRRSAGVAEIVGRSDDALAEMMLPDAVDHHARGQRVVGAGEPTGQGQTPAAAAIACGRMASGRASGRPSTLKNAG